MTKQSLLLAELDAPMAEKFDRFMAASPFAAYQQCRTWAAMVPRSRVQDYLHFLLLDGDAPIGAAVVRRTWLAAGAWLATVQRGPVVHDATVMETVLAHMLVALREAGCCSVQLAPRVRGRAIPIMAEAMRANGFVPLPDTRQPLHTSTGIVWLDKPEADILAGFKQRGRRQIKAAVKAGVTVRTASTAEDIATYQGLLDTFRAARPDYDMAGLPDAAGQAALIEQLGGAMLLAEIDGQPVGGHAFVRQADEAIWLSLATHTDQTTVALSYPLLWEAMRLAREMGAVGYDLAGLPAGEPRDPGEANRVQFKTAFAPHSRLMPPMQVAALKPVQHMLLFGARQFYRDSRLGRRVASAVGGLR